MPSWTEVLKLLGFSTPFIYAAATYGFFHWLDRKASGPAKRAISGWLEPKEYDKAAVQAAVLEVFDKVYTRPLLAWRAFFRSMAISVITLFIFLHELGLDVKLANSYYWPDEDLLRYVLWYFIFPFMLTINVVFDFIALFVVRHWLAKHNLSPAKALIIGPFMGILLVAALLVIRNTIIDVVADWLLGRISTSLNDAAWYVSYIIQMFVGYAPGKSLPDAAVTAALFVHLWLPFFALCVGLVKGSNYFLFATKHAQWFLKQGQQHPFDALGLVAAPLVFIIAVAVQMLVSK
jgi:hypothetical protein